MHSLWNVAISLPQSDSSWGRTHFCWRVSARRPHPAWDNEWQSTPISSSVPVDFWPLLLSWGTFQPRAGTSSHSHAEMKQLIWRIVLNFSIFSRMFFWSVNQQHEFSLPGGFLGNQNSKICAKSQWDRIFLIKCWIFLYFAELKLLIQFPKFAVNFHHFFVN